MGGNIRPPGGSQPPPVQPGDVSESSQTTGQGTPIDGQQQPSEATPRTTPRDSAQRRAEHGIGGAAREAELRGRAPGSDVSQIVNRARTSGLNQQELQRLESRLNGMSAENRSTEIRFLDRNVFGTPNSDRALRTYLDVRDMQERYPARISDRTVHTLTRAVAEPRSQSRNGLEGVMSHQQALNTAVALTLTSDQHHSRLERVLDIAGTRGGQPVPGADPHYERALILKSLGARTNRLLETDSGPYNPAGPMSRNPSFMQEIEQYSDAIRGSRRQDLIRSSTFLDLQGTGEGRALQQVFNDSCAPTSSQIAQAEADPIYSWSAHRNPAVIIAGQQTRLEQTGGRAVARGEEGGRGTSTGDVFNRYVSRYTGQTYNTRSVADTPAGRREALDQMDQIVRSGVDVPISVGWPNGGGHALLVSDVRGTGANRDFLVTDPWSGRTRWYSSDELASGRTEFPGTGTGRLRTYYGP